jgi:opacity protein-like surface antigen
MRQKMSVLREERTVRNVMQRFLVVSAMIVGLCGSASAQQMEKDWYLALRLGYQPYMIDVEGKVANRDFDVSANLKDILDKTDTTIFGGEVEFGKGKWFLNFAGFHQKTEADKGDMTLGAEVTLKETGLNPMLGYRVYATRLGGDKALLVDAMAGIYYVKVRTDLDVYLPRLGKLSRSADIDFVDPMLVLQRDFNMI